MRTEVDTERCIGSGMCALTAGEVFDQRESDGKAVVLRPQPPADTWDAVRDAAGLCPVAAITLWADDRSGT
ncbi:ferredoxin [Streptomyces qinglanensis]|uniref:Ferredoxin n=1 Tax=Streptomyces qinglanensis TaxID=943816 RepID=A0A1E7K527_9ACTN|nr:ferredoxin [Streptomyces qinglanensis]OEU99005.1 ferredoxin [Streptomyces qinglanensis]